MISRVRTRGVGGSPGIEELTGTLYKIRDGLLLRYEWFRSPAEARAMGIEAVYQDLAIVDQLSLWRNFFLGKEIVYTVGPLRVLGRRRTSCARGPTIPRRL